MNKIYLIMKFCLLTVVLSLLAACTEKETVVLPVFPEEETVETVVPGTEYALTFTANMDWELKSSALWCKFSNGLISIKGEAGNVTQTITVNEDNWTLEDAVAEITLVMGNEEKVIAQYTRKGKAMAVVDANDVAYGDDNTVLFQYKEIGNGKEISFLANYDWTINELPEWIVVEDAPLSGTNSVLKTIKVTIADNYPAFAKKGSIKIKNKDDNEKFCEIPVAYSGIDRISSDVNPWGGYTFDAKGETYTSDNPQTGEETFQAPLTIDNLLINGNDYKVLYFEEFAPYQYRIKDGISWASLSIQPYEGTEIYKSVLSVQNNDTNNERNAVVVVMPSDTLNTVGVDNLLNADADFTEFASKYVLVSFSQAGPTVVSGDFYVDSDSGEAINVMKVSSPSAEEIEYCGTDNIYTLHLKPHTSYSLFNIGSDLYSMEAGYMWVNLGQNNPEKYPHWGTNDFFSGQYMFWNGITAENGYGEDGEPLKPLCIAIQGWNEETATETRVAALLIYRE